MKKFFGFGLLFSIIFASSAFAGDKSLTAIFGSSFNGNSKTLIGKAGPSRDKKGELLVFTFRSPVTINSLRLLGVSSSKKGKTWVKYALVRAVANDNSADVSLDALWSFFSSTGNAKNFQNYVMLEDTNAVSVSLDKAYTQLVLEVQGVGDKDASLYVEMLFNEEIENKDFSITRTGGSNEVLGGLIDESNYKNFKGPQLAALMKAAIDPSTDLLDGHSYSCSVYGAQIKPGLDYKERQFFLDNEVLSSTSTSDRTQASWAWMDNGWTLPIPWKNPCGMSTSNIVLKMTPEGNTISETTLTRYDFDMLCFKSKGIGQSEVESALNKATFPSVIDNAAYAVLSYEFCRLIK